jgi:hypothetical protein
MLAVVITAAVCLPLGAMLQRDAAADRRKSSLPHDVALRHRRLLVTNQAWITAIDGHPHLALAQAAVREAAAEIVASQQAAEPMWSDQSGRAEVTRDAIAHATDVVEHTAQWIGEGMARNASPWR